MSATVNTATTRPSIAPTIAPFWRSCGSSGHEEAGAGSVCSATNAGRPATTARPSTTPRTPRPSWLRKPTRLGSGPSALAAAAIARAIGCSEASSSAPISLSASARSIPLVCTSVSVIRPVVTVPVLSSTIVSTLRVDSRTSGPLISSPSWAPRPVPTSSATGVASPSAHGQAMISTATAAVNANVAVSPVPSQKPSVATASAITIGTNTRGDAIGEPLHVGLARLGVGDELGDLRQRGVLADLRGADDQAAAGVDRRARHVVAGADLDGDRTRPSAGSCRRPSCPRRRSRRWRPSRPGGPRSRRRPSAARSAIVRPSRRLTSLAPSSSRAFSAAPARRLARASK